jgi:hypothetical protein
LKRESAASYAGPDVRHSSRQALEAVIDRARRLASSPLAKEPLDLDVRWTPPEPPTLIAPDQLGLEAALRIVRQFMQPSESICFQVLREKLSDDPDLSAPFRRDLDKLVRELAVTLDQPPVMRFKIKGQLPTPPSSRDLLEGLLHGSVEHLDPKRRETLATWLTQPVSALLARAQLQTALGSVCKAIQRLRSLCERELLRAAS